VEPGDLIVLTKSGRGLMTAPMINALTIIARRRRILAAADGVRV
jgi:hypothetical protein